MRDSKNVKFEGRFGASAGVRSGSASEGIYDTLTERKRVQLGPDKTLGETFSF